LVSPICVCLRPSGLDDLRAWHANFAHRCQAAAARPASYTKLGDLERKLRCGSCGNRQGNILSVSKALRN
jgi:hypothetical protein